MVSELLLCIGQENYSTIPQDVIKRINEHFAVKQAANDELTAKIDSLHTDYEQKCYELDKKIIETSTALERESSISKKLSTENELLKKEVAKFSEENESLQTNVSAEHQEITRLKRERDALQEEKLSIEHTLQKRETELYRITEEWKLVSDKLNKAVNNKNEIEINLDELQNKSLNFDYEIKKVQQEKERLEQQNKDISVQFRTLETESSATKFEKTTELVNLRSRLEEKISECNVMSVNLNSVRKTNLEYQEKINNLLEKISKGQEEHAAMEELYKNELQSQTKLAELYKSAANEAEEKANELSSAVTELQRLIGSSSEANAIAQQQINELDIKNRNLIKETEKLMKEIEKANDLLSASKTNTTLTEEELNKLCPTAAMASKFIKSGMTLTEIYSKYIEVSDECDTLKLENKRLNQTMDSILSELNEKAPILKQQREDYERALATISQLTSQMDNAVIESQHLQTRTDAVNRKFGIVQREKERLQKESIDLSKQVQFLLKEISEIKGGTVTIGNQSSVNISMQEDELSSSVITSSDAIDSRLLTFKDVAELQQQNKNLLAVVRELSEEREKEDSLMTNKRVQELKFTLDSTTEELDSLKGERMRQGDLIEALVKQRDMYRVLLANDPNATIAPSMLADPTSLTKSPKFPSRSNKADSNKENENAINTLQKEFNDYKLQTNENIKLYKEQIERLHKESSDLRTASAKFEALFEFKAESAKILKQTNEDMKKENQILKEKSNQQQLLLQKQELSLVDTSNKLSNIHKTKATLEAKLEAATSEITLLKRTEDRLKSEISFFSKEQRGQSVLLANLQKIQQTVERQEFEVRTQMRQQIESQESELKSSRQAMKQITEEKQQAIQAIEKQLLLVQTNYERQCEKSLETSKLLIDEVEKYQICEMLKNQLQAKLTSIEKRMKNLSDIKGMAITVEAGGNEDSVKELKEELDAVKEELNATKSKLEKTNMAIQQHKKISMAAEESLKQANMANKELSEALNSRLSSANDQIVRVEQKMAELQSDNLKLSSNKSDLINEVDRQTEGLNKQIASLQAELDETLNRLKIAQRCEHDARNELQEQSLVAKEANDNYQKEMIMHATDVQQMLKLKEASEKHDQDMNEQKVKLLAAESQLSAQKEMLASTENKFQIEIEEMQTRSGGLEQQNGVLHERIEYLSNQLSEAQKKFTKQPSYLSPIKQLTHDAADDQAKSDEQLMDIVKFLRKEKALFETKFDVASTESKRLNHQVQSLQNQLQIVQRCLVDEREKSSKLVQKEAEYDAIIKKLETLNVLTDSNRLLRAERDKLVVELNKMTDLMSTLQNRITPLQNENRELSMQNNTIKTEKTSLEQDLQRWQQRAQTLTQSANKRDPEELKRLQNDKAQLTKSNEILTKQLQQKCSELSVAQNEIRNNETQIATCKSEKEVTDGKLSTAEKELETKIKNINQVKRVGRRYKQLYEELQKKIQENEKTAAAVKQPETSTEITPIIDQKSEDSAKLNLVEASLVRVNTARAELQKQLTSANQTIQDQQKKIEELTTELETAKQGSSKPGNSNQEVSKLKSENEVLKKTVLENQEKNKKTLAWTRNKLQQIQKDLSESNSENELLKSAENLFKKQLDTLKSNEKQSLEKQTKLQKKVEEMEKQLQSMQATAQQQVKLSNEARVRQNAASGAGDRKAANIRPMSTTLVSQVSPLRVTRTARVMPEPHQEVVEGISATSESLPTRVSSPQTQVSTSHMTTMSSVIPQSTTQPTRALVHPTRYRISPANSTPSGTGDAQRVDPQSDSAAASAPETRRLNEGRITVPSSSTGSSVSRPESDQAIVSSSDDQTVFHEEEVSQTGQQASASSSEQTQSCPARHTSDADPSSSMTKIFPNRSKAINKESKAVEIRSIDMTASSSDSKVAVIPVQSIQDRKRAHDDENDDDAIAESSSDSKGSAPVSKRQRNSPDQSSESVTEKEPATTSQSISANQITTLQSTQTETTHGDASLTRVQPIRPVVEVQGEVSSNQFPVTSTVQAMQSSNTQPAITTSQDSSPPVEDQSIVISSDEEETPQAIETNEAEQNEPFQATEYQDAMLDEVSGSNQSANEPIVIPQSAISGNSRPALVINPPPPESVPRNRMFGRPAPLTPGLVPATNVLPSSNDDGDGIVPCTPTLPAHTHDDNYQTINSPHVPSMSGPPIQFRFDDNVPVQSSLGEQRGLGAVDNTLMDLGGAEEEPPQTIPSDEMIQPAEIEPQNFVGRSMVSSSFAESVSEVAISTEAEEEIPEDFSRECSSTEVTEQPLINPQNVKQKRRILLIKRPKGKGGESPSSSN